MIAGNLVSVSNTRRAAEAADLFFMGPEGITRTNGEADVSARVGRTSTAGAVQLWNQCLKKQGVLPGHGKVQGKAR